MTPEQYLLASAYLDGELTDEERRLAEADPAVMAEVEELRALHVDLAVVEPPTVEARESAIAAAMAAFSPAAAPSATVPATAATAAAPVVAFKPRPAYAKYLGIAAAVVAVGLLGTVIVNTAGGGDDEASFDASRENTDGAFTERAVSESTEAPADEPASEPEVMAAAEDTAADMAIAEAPVLDDTGGAADAPAEQPAEETATADTEMASPDPSLPGDDTLIVFAEDILFRRDAGELPPTPNTSCTVSDAPNAFILERADVPTELGSVELLLAIDDTTRMVYGIDPETCETLVDAPLP